MKKLLVVALASIAVFVLPVTASIAAERSAYVFGIVTYGGDPGASLLQLDKILKQNGSKLSSGFKVKMPGNYTPLYGAIESEKQKLLFEKEKERISQIADIVKERAFADIEKGFFLFNVLSKLFYKFSAPKIPAMDKKFWADEKCNSCGTCAKVCPVGNIILNNGKPEWLHKCEQCMACLQWCPQISIQYGKSTQNRKRYQHQDIKIADIIVERV